MNKNHKIILEKLAKLCEEHPEQRFGQILFNYTKIGTRAETLGTIKDPFHYEDDDFIKVMEKYEELEGVEWQ